MYKVIIVDDEDVIGQGLSRLIDWKSFDFEVVAVCNNANDAITANSYTPADLIITDIKMPKTTGLEMIKQMRSNGYKGEFFISSGYADFDYARQAIHYGVASYLLKPIDERELVGELYALKKKLATKIQTPTIETLKDNEDKIVESFLMKDLPYNDFFSKITVSMLSTLSKCKSIVLIRISEYHSHNIEDAFWSNISTDLNLCKLFFKDDIQIFASTYDNSYLFDEIIPELKEKLQTITDKDFLISIGREVNSLASLPVSFDDSIEQLKSQFHLRNNHLIKYDTRKNLKPIDIDPAVFIDENILADIINSEEEKFSIDVDTLHKILSVSHLSEIEIKTLFVNLIFKTISKLENVYSAINESPPDTQVLIEEVYFSTSLINLVTTVKNMIIDIMYTVNNHRSKTSMEEILVYIENNLQQKLSLNFIAEEFHYNKAYLGRKFKQDTGMFFNDYLNSKRIEWASKLLLSGFRISKISEMIGYKSPDYFIAQFKKIKGYSPSHYKQIHEIAE